jgi:sugar-specific transcriptional regulator TrmB
MNIINQDLVKKLEKGGFTDKEALVYVSLLELGGAFPSRIAEYSGLNRSTTYKILLNLSIRGIINEIEKKNKIYYQIEKPEKVLRYSQTKLRQAEDSIEEVKKIMPDIEGLYNSGQNRPKITYFDNEEGILSIYTDMITDQKPYDMLAFSGPGNFSDFGHDDFFRKYVKEKERLNITTRGIIPNEDRDKKYVSGLFENVGNKYKPQIKFVSKGNFSSSSEITVYGTNKVSIINFAKNKLSGIIIEDTSIHDMLKTVFELSWNSNDVVK